MPILKATNGKEVYIHDRFPMVVSSLAGGLQCKVVIPHAAGFMETEVEGSLATIAKAFEGEPAACTIEPASASACICEACTICR